MLKEVFKRDHGRLLVLFEKLLAEKTNEKLVVFSGNLRRHIEIENEIIYGPHGQGELRAPGLRILSEHTEFISFLDKLEAGGVGSIEEDEIGGLKQKFIEHNLFEDDNFYPILDVLLTEDERGDIVDEVKDEVRFDVSG